MTKQVPKQQPTTSKQDVGTPKEFLNAVENHFGKITLDLAAHEGNHVTDLWFGPGSKCPDSLVTDWYEYTKYTDAGIYYLNPPFGMIPKFVEKCSLEADKGTRIAVLLPMALETKWYFKYVYRQAYTLILMPRLKFVGHTNVFPKGLILAYYDNNFRPKQAIELWSWKEDMVY